jgi:hypothetical protein
LISRRNAATNSTLLYRLDSVQAPPEVYAPFNEKLLKLWKEKDALELECERTQDDDEEIIEELERESRMVGGDLSGHVARLSDASASESRERRLIAQLEMQVHRAKRICAAEKRHQKHTEKMHENDDETAEGLEKMIEDCKRGKHPESGLTCAELESKLKALSGHLDTQKQAAIAQHESNIEECETRQQELNLRIEAAEDKRAEYYEELDRLQGIETNMQAEAAAVRQRLNRTKENAMNSKETCDEKVAQYKQEMKEIKEKRWEAATKAAGERVVDSLDCKVSDWRYQQCSKKCKRDASDTHGVLKASRTVDSPPMFGGMGCPELSEEFPCNDHICPIDCEVSEWMAWGDCDKQCGYGTQTRDRKVLVEPTDNGRWCPPMQQRRLCNIHKCSGQCQFSQWTSWSSCSRQCKFNKEVLAGQQTRIRRAFESGGNECPAENDESRLQSQPCDSEEICKDGMSCKASQDILFLVDASGDLGEAYADQLKSVSSIAKKSSDDVKVGILSYGKETKVVSDITADRESLASAAEYQPPSGGSRNAAEAISTAATLFSSLDLDWSRQRTAVLFLGGDVVGHSDIKDAADDLKAADVRVVVVLVDKGDALAKSRACDFASFPCTGSVEYVQRWNEVVDADRLLPTICSGKIVTTIDDPNVIDWRIPA